MIESRKKGLSRMDGRLLLLVTFLLPGLFGGCLPPGMGKSAGTQDETEETGPESMTPSAIPVEAHPPRRKSISDYYEATSRVEAENRVEVAARGSGQCIQVHVEEGDRVRENAVLAELDREELAAQIAQSKVNLDQTRYQMETAREQAAEGVLSEYEAENARFAWEQAAATLKTQEVQLANQTIRAPIGGIVAERMIQQGMLVTSGLPVFTLVDPDSYMLPVSVPEKEVARIAEGQQAEVRVDLHGTKTFPAEVARINPMVDMQSGMVKVLLAFAPEDRPFLREAAFARIRLVLETHENALVVPKDAVIERRGRQVVMVAEEAAGKNAGAEQEAAPAADDPGSDPAWVAKTVPVETGFEDSEDIELLSGISEDSLVITVGQHTLKADSPVKVTTAEEAVAGHGRETAGTASS
jgi:membrane fusion protein, multidrug efflux system